MEMKLRIEWPHADGDCLIASTDFPGFSVFGPTLEKALDELRIALPGFLEVVKQDTGKQG